MKNQRGENQSARSARQLSPAVPYTIESLTNPGQIEQVVSSADCRQVEPPDSQNSGHYALQANIRVGETAGTARLDANQLPFDDPPLSLEDRLYIALSARGSLSMCQAIVLATGAVQPFYVKDEDLVSLVEDWVFGAKGSRDGGSE